MSKLILKDNEFTNIRTFGKDLFLNYINNNGMKVILAARTADNGLDYELWINPEFDNHENIERIFRVNSPTILQEFELYDEGDCVKIPINWMDMDRSVVFTNTGEGTSNIDIDISFSNNGDE